MKKILLVIGILIYINAAYADTPRMTTSAQIATHEIRSIDEEAGRNLNFTLPKPTYQTCQDLVNAVQKEILSQYSLEPTAGLTAANDTACTTNPLFLFAEDIVKKTDASAYSAIVQPNQGLTKSSATRPAAINLRNTHLQELGVLNNLDVVSKMIDALQRKQYGNFVRELGLINGALACSSHNSVRVLDLMFAEILAASMDGGLSSTAEQQKCVQGTFNAALNTFDQIQYTGYSLVQRVLTQDNPKARTLLYPQYPVCDAGIWVYDFITGKLIQLKDEKACKKDSNNFFNNIFDSTKGEKKASNKYRFLLGYLDQFADPRRFGSGFCSEYYVAGSKNFTCDVGLICKNTGVNPDLRNIIDGVSDLSDSKLAQLKGSITGHVKPTRFGIPVGLAEDFLCGRGVDAGDSASLDKNRAMAAFGQLAMDPPGSLDDLSKEGNGPESDASRNFFKCQASVLFDTKMDPTTSCILNAMNNIMLEEKRQSMPDGGRGPTDPSFIIGGVKDPACQRGDPESEANDKAREFAEKADKDKKAVPESKLKGAERGVLAEAIQGATQSAKAEMNDRPGYTSRFIDNAIETFAGGIRFKFVEGLKAETGKDYVLGSGSIIYYDRDLARSKDLANETTVIKDSIVSFMTEILPLKRVDAPFTPSGAVPDPGHVSSSRNRDPAIDQALNSACTSAYDRALNTLGQCGTPDRSSQPRSDGRPQGGGGLPGVHPTVVDPDPQGVGVIPPLGTVMDGLMACVDQYGKEVSEHSGSKFGPGGCLSPMTLCNTKDCKTYQSNCSQSGQWQCSFALCREDGACCGSPHTSRGGGLGDTPGEHTANTVDCGEDKVWNSAKRACNDPNGCGDGWTYNANSGLCEPLAPIPTGGRGPGGPEQPVNNNTIPTGNGDPGTLTGCPEGTRLPGGRCGPPH